MGAITDWMTAVGTDGTGLIAIGAAVPAYRAVRESRRLREDQARPFVVVTLEPSNISRHFLDLVVRNKGNTVARDVTFSFDEKLRSTNDDFGYPIAEVKFLQEGIDVFAPGAEYRVMFDSMPDRNRASAGGANLPDSYKVTVEYKNRVGDLLPAEEYVLDCALSRGAPYAQEYNMHSLVEEVTKLRKELQERS